MLHVCRALPAEFKGRSPGVMGGGAWRIWVWVWGMRSYSQKSKKMLFMKNRYFKTIFLHISAQKEHFFWNTKNFYA